MKRFTTRRLAAALFAVLLAACLLLAGCGAAPAEQTAAASTAAAGEMEYYAYDAAPAEGAYAPEVAMDSGAVYGTGADGPALSLPQDGRKVVLTANLTIEALDYKATCEALQQAALDAGGYVSSTSISGGEAGSGRTAQFTMRIPAENYGRFIEAAGEAGNMLSRTENSDDVTDQYVDIESRLKALRTQEARLLELMEESARLTDLLEVQDKLTEVQYEIEYYTGQKRSLDSLTTYSTVYIDVREVRQVTEPVEDTWLSRLGATFRQSWRTAGTFFQELALFLVRILPLLLFVGIALAVAIPLVRRAAKKRAANPKPPNAPPAYGYPAAPARPAGDKGAWPPYPPAASGAPKAGASQAEGSAGSETCEDRPAGGEAAPAPAATGAAEPAAPADKPAEADPPAGKAESNSGQ